MARRIAPWSVGVLILAFSSGSWGWTNANGIGYFALEVPADVTIEIDGRLDDWGWFDPAFVIGPDQMHENITEVMPPKDDLDIAFRIAWTGTDRDNRVYGFARVADDTLVVVENRLDWGWNDDAVEVIIDADNSGGPMDATGTWGEQAQQHVIHVPVPGVWESPAPLDGSWYFLYNVPPEMHWEDLTGLSKVRTEPEGAATGTANVVVNYEWSQPAWDLASAQGEEASIRHNLTAGETIAMTVKVDDNDTAEVGRSHQVTTAATWGISGNTDNSSTFTLLGIGDYTTAVEDQAWGRIKATFAP